MGCCGHNLLYDHHDEARRQLPPHADFAPSRENNTKNITFLNDGNWMQYVEDDRVTLLFFMTGNHWDCRKHIPKVIEFANRFGNRYNVAVIDVARNQEAVACCGIREIPTAAILRNGMHLGTLRGGLDETTEGELLIGLDKIQNMDLEKYDRTTQATATCIVI